MRAKLAAPALAVAAVVTAALVWHGSHDRKPAAISAAPFVVVPRLELRPAPKQQVLLHLPARLPARSLDLPILMYHRIDVVKASLPEITQRLTVAPGVFDAQMRWLVRNGFHTVTPLQAFEALEYRRALPSHPVLITFDDGYRDVLGKAAPELHRLHLHAVEFVITGRTSGPDPSFLTWPELFRLQRLGVSIGSHTVTHRVLTELPPSQAFAELRDSRAALQRHLGHPVQWFAYPFGAVDAQAARMVRRAGYVLAVTTAGGSEQSGRAPLLLHRDEVLDTTGVAGFAALLGG
jgi:peptidoglycan/xylan/chitin deacetylase (PgdA/CDA1 family)